MKRFCVRAPYLLCAFVFVLLLADQWSKIYVKTHFYLGELYPVMGQWFYLCFVENEGMAFGWKLGSGHTAKIILSVVRIVLISYFVYILWRTTRANRPTAFTYFFALILAGAVGNLIDSLFYGLIFNDPSATSTYGIASLFGKPAYGNFLAGRVVDMFYFPLFSGHFPKWVPFVGGEDFLFFSPVFNLADAYITVGVALMIGFWKQIRPLRHHRPPTSCISSSYEHTHTNYR